MEPIRVEPIIYFHRALYLIIAASFIIGVPILGWHILNPVSFIERFASVLGVIAYEVSIGIVAAFIAWAVSE